MNRSGLTSSLRKSYSNEPRRTLSFVVEADIDSDSDQKQSFSESSAHADKHKSKTEKSVHFADEESIADDASSLTNEQTTSESSEGGITWIPSEDLYNEDTFTQDTETTARDNHSQDPTTIATVPSYGSSTFVQLDSSEEDNTDTEQLYSYTDSFMSSDVFTTQSGSTTYKSWRDVTEIVKDIEELEESEFVTRADSLEFDQGEGEETEASDSLDEEMAELARLDFVTSALRHLRLKELQSPRSLAIDSITSGQNIQKSQLPPSTPRSKEEKQFCLRMIQKCKKKSKTESTTKSKSQSKSIHPLYKEVERQKNQPVEFYGLNSAVVERLRLSNLQAALNKKAHDLDKDITNSKSFVKTTTEDTGLAKDQFVSEVCSRIRRENVEDAIQAHLIKMHPVTKFAEFVKDLPPAGEDTREILYQYKRQLERRMANGVT